MQLPRACLRWQPFGSEYIALKGLVHQVGRCNQMSPEKHGSHFFHKADKTWFWYISLNQPCGLGYIHAALLRRAEAYLRLLILLARRAVNIYLYGIFFSRQKSRKYYQNWYTVYLEMCVTVDVSNKGDRLFGHVSKKLLAQNANARENLPSHFFAFASPLLSVVVYPLSFSNTTWSS